MVLRAKWFFDFFISLVDALFHASTQLVQGREQGLVARRIRQTAQSSFEPP